MTAILERRESETRSDEIENLRFLLIGDGVTKQGEEEEEENDDSNRSWCWS
jgi:hypothetical protein